MSAAWERNPQLSLVPLRRHPGLLVSRLIGKGKDASPRGAGRGLRQPSILIRCQRYGPRLAFFDERGLGDFDRVIFYAGSF
jgi:hypothetical protein